MTSKPVTGRERDFVIWLDKQIYGLSKHWLAVFNTLVLVYVGLPFVAPVLMKTGLTGPANLIYTAYSPLCHQFAFRSWFLFGKNFFYEAPAFKALTGIDPYNLLDRFAAKAFVGNEIMGYKVAYCERDVAIYGAILVAGLIFAIVRASGVKIKPLNIFVYGLVGIAPIALDGFSQLFSQPPFNFLPLRESTPYLRTLTGFLFGAMNVWLAYPYVEDSFAEIKAELTAKLTQAGELKT
ncbi:MAG: DUF2085 domain-containing protein [Chloroflexi bacterium]|nr:DUF2085 domain-containing protein [Chloroflexota bacterium]